ncbi:sensor histidine kinase [Cohnella luojiensis]|uniref:Sensor histidine kinase n=1 Tax=Cohnella luojiensis TaxID=652876 RepID=A0A4Y8LV96_9BACL|nr:sensor histidine kinase [Cohnella luojiensis]TFE25562.1 sensor histidine kinase [Cohnella luojiensis]
MAFLRKLSIRSQLVILAASTIIVILIVIFHSYSMMSGMVTRNHEEYVEQTVSEIRKNVTSNKDVINRLMQNISYNGEVQRFLVEENDLLKYEQFKDLSELITNQKELKEGILDIVISGVNGAWIDLYGGNKYVSSLQSAVPPKVNAHYVGMQKFGNLYGSGEGLIFATPIYYKEQGEMFNRLVGTLFFIMNPKALAGEQEYASKQHSSHIYLLDRDHKVITSNSQEPVGSRLQDIPAGGQSEEDTMIEWKDKNYVMQTVNLPDIEGSILSMAPKDELLADLLDIRRLELTILGICLLVLVIPFMFIVNNILRPLKKLIFFMTTVKRGDLLKFKKRISLQGYMEISIMASELNSMLDEIDHLTQRLLETNSRLYGIELEKKKSELAFLRSQINPHFLYNTLEAITGIAVVEGQNKIKTMTRSLSSIFRYSIKGGDVVPLSDEVKMIESYVQIQQIRFADRFSVHYEMTDEALAFAIPKMILQPLVENAVYHGFEPTLKAGELWIKGFVDEQRTLIVTVEDNGTGIEPSKLEELRNKLSVSSSGEPGAEDGGSIGLVNVNNRIKLMFGNECGISLESVLGEGTCIRLAIAERRESNA